VIEDLKQMCHPRRNDSLDTGKEETSTINIKYSGQTAQEILQHSQADKCQCEECTNQRRSRKLLERNCGKKVQHNEEA